MLTICGAAFVGLLDDWLKVTRQRSLGLNKRAKIAGQFVVAFAFAMVSVEWLRVDTHLSFTRCNSLGLPLGKVGWVIFAVLVIVESYERGEPDGRPGRPRFGFFRVRVRRLYRDWFLPAEARGHIQEPGVP